MVIDYDSKYDEQIKDLLVELQKHIASLDEERYNILTDDYREECFIKNIEEIKKYEGKMLLMNENEIITGLIIGIINNEEIDTYDFKAPKRGRITELIVSETNRNKGTGAILLKAMEEYLKSVGCKDILLGVFAYNEAALRFYKKHGYHNRTIDMIKHKL